MRAAGAFVAAVGASALLAAAACSGSDAVILTNSLLAADSAVRPPVVRAVDAVRGWKRVGPVERFGGDGLYGYIDGGAELVLQYGFRELSVLKLRPAAAPRDEARELVVEAYRMESGPAAFGLFSTKLEGGERPIPGVRSASWIVPGQASFVRGDLVVSALAPGTAEDEIATFAAALERRLPGRRDVRPKGLGGLPAEGMMEGSGRYIRGPLAARNESPFLEGDLWGFGEGGTEAFSAKYGAPPAVSKLVVVRLGGRREKEVAAGELADRVLESFEALLVDVRCEGGLVEGRNPAGRWFLFRASGTTAAFVLGEIDRQAGLARLEKALALAGRL